MHDRNLIISYFLLSKSFRYERKKQDLKNTEKNEKSRKDRKKAENLSKSRIFLLKAEEVAGLHVLFFFCMNSYFKIKRSKF